MEVKVFYEAMQEIVGSLNNNARQERFKSAFVATVDIKSNNKFLL